MNPIIKRFGAFSSSINPQELSLTVESIAKVVAGALLFFGVISAEDALTITSQTAQVITTIAAIVPLGYSIWHGANSIYGIIRKVIVRVSQKEAAPTQAVSSV